MLHRLKFQHCLLQTGKGLFREENSGRVFQCSLVRENTSHRFQYAARTIGDHGLAELWASMGTIPKSSSPGKSSARHPARFLRSSVSLTGLRNSTVGMSARGLNSRQTSEKYVSLGKDLCQSFDNPLTPTTCNEPVVNNGNTKLRQLRSLKFVCASSSVSSTTNSPRRCWSRCNEYL